MSHTLAPSNMVFGRLGDQVLGAFFISVGALLTVAGLNGMKYAQLRYGGVRSWRWCGGFFMWGCGQGTFIFASYFATVSVCAATANLAIPFNAIIASRYFGETFRWWPRFRRRDGRILRELLEWDLLGLICIGFGAIVIVVFAPVPPDGAVTYTPAAEQNMLQKPLALTFLLIMGPGILMATAPLTYCASSRAGTGRKSMCNKPVNRAIAYGLICGAMGAHTFV